MPKDSQIVELDDGRYLVTKDDDGNDIAVSVDETYALAEIKKSEASVLISREEQKTKRMNLGVQAVIILSIIATCALT